MDRRMQLIGLEGGFDVESGENITTSEIPLIVAEAGAPDSTKLYVTGQMLAQYRSEHVAFQHVYSYPAITIGGHPTAEDKRRLSIRQLDGEGPSFDAVIADTAQFLNRKSVEISKHGTHERVELTLGDRVRFIKPRAIKERLDEHIWHEILRQAGLSQYMTAEQNPHNASPETAPWYSMDLRAESGASVRVGTVESGFHVEVRYPVDDAHYDRAINNIRFERSSRDGDGFSGIVSGKQIANIPELLSNAVRIPRVASPASCVNP